MNNIDVQANNSIPIDLLWLRPGKVGGTESFVRNLLDGFMKLEDDFRFTLLVSQDNKDTFKHYLDGDRFSILEAPIPSANIAHRIIWQNLHQNRFLRKHGFTKCFEPVYCKPWFNGGIEYTCVIHDLQAMHYPEYHPFHEVAYSKICWKMDTLNAHKIIAISNFVKKDIEVIYNPITIKEDELAPFENIKTKYDVEEKGYLYTVSQLIPHKNLETLISLMELIKSQASATNIPTKLIISGVNGQSAEKLNGLIKEKNLEGNIILSGFVDNEVRNALYKHAYAFLFPSVFEGFGMPPIESMLFGTPTITTRCASLYEVTQGCAEYVDNPYDAEEWYAKLRSLSMNQNAQKAITSKMDFGIYDGERIARQYLDAIVG